MYNVIETKTNRQTSTSIAYIYIYRNSQIFYKLNKNDFHNIKDVVPLLMEAMYTLMIIFSNNINKTNIITL